jgi:hypothetical protein
VGKIPIEFSTCSTVKEIKKHDPGTSKNILVIFDISIFGFIKNVTLRERYDC